MPDKLSGRLTPERRLDGTLNNKGTLRGVLGGTGAVVKYASLPDKPSINGVTLVGNKTTSDLNINYNDLKNLPSIPDVGEIDERLDNLEGNITSLGGRVTTAEGNITDLQGDTSALDTRLTTAEENITSLGGRVTTAEGNITSLGGRVTTAEGNITDLQGNTSALDTRLTTAEGNITSLGGRITTAEGNITSLGGRITTAEGNITSLDGRVTTNEGDILDLQGDMSQAQSDITQLNSSFTNIATTLNSATLASGVTGDLYYIKLGRIVVFTGSLATTSASSAGTILASNMPSPRFVNISFRGLNNNAASSFYDCYIDNTGAFRIVATTAGVSLRVAGSYISNT